ncbi:hypothetical protein TIFTF001_043881 [Ficus carica]|uniref:Uncharacterized protein n=1 Tax=Ficus carica TaxID=3494 RepID=A0AA88CQ82_FICCA|nr:hypothetical protein TIFTF001_043881 [Ficus carica]
MKGIASVR